MSEPPAHTYNEDGSGGNDHNIEQWRIKKLIKSLEAARG